MPFSMGNKKRVRFWKHRWIHSAPHLFSLFVQLKSFKNGFSKQLNSWEVVFVEFFFSFYLFILAAIVKEVSQGRQQSSGMDKVKGWKFYCQISLEGFGCRKIR